MEKHLRVKPDLLSANGIAQQPGRLAGHYTSEGRNGGPVCCSALLAGALLCLNQSL